jgi:hypothetical protein
MDIQVDIDCDASVRWLLNRWFSTLELDAHQHVGDGVAAELDTRLKERREGESIDTMRGMRRRGLGIESAS